MVNICVGAGNRPLPGFKNFDLFSNEKVTYSRADSLYLVTDNSVQILFSNAVFEHIFTSEHRQVLSEWKRVLADDGTIVCLGIPYFDLVAKLYLSNKLDAKKTHDYTTGVIEHCDSYEYLMGQIHKALYNHKRLTNIFEANGLYPNVFNYCYPGEKYPVNLGVIASTAPIFTSTNILKYIPTIKEYIDLDTIEYDS